MGFNTAGNYAMGNSVDYNMLRYQTGVAQNVPNWNSTFGDTQMYVGMPYTGTGITQVPVEKHVEISDYTLPQPNKTYSDDEVAQAQKDLSELSPQEQAQVRKAYENGMKEYQKILSREATMIGIGLDTTSVDEFLADHPEYAESFRLMGAIAQDYNAYIQEAADNYYENAPWYEKIMLNLGMETGGKKLTMQQAQQQYMEMCGDDSE